MPMKKEKLRLVAILAREGTEGERQAALSILDSLGISMEDIEIENDEDVILTYKTSNEKRLIIQLYCKTMNVNSITYIRLGNRKFSIKIPKTKVKRFKEDTKTILSSWRKELKTLESAFIQANRLFSDIPSGCSSSLSEQEIEDILSMSKNIKNVTLGKL